MKYLRNGLVRLLLAGALFADLTYMVISFYAEYTGIDPLYAFGDLAVPHFTSLQKIMMMLLAVLLFIAFTASIGYHRGSEEVELSFIDRIPYEIFLVLFAAAAVIFTVILFEAVEEIYYRLLNDTYYRSTFFKNTQAFLWPFFGLWTGIYTAGMLIWDTTVSRLKNKSFLKTTFVGTALVPMCRWLWKIIVKVLRWLAIPFVALWKVAARFFKALRVYVIDITGSLPLAAIFARILSVSFLIDVFMVGTRDRPLMVANRFVQSVIGFVLLSLMTIGYQKIRQGIRKIARGDLDYEIDDSNMPVFMKRQVADLNGINRAVTNAVDRQMKSERLKTELITNVSHDIKTPLTSIINYVDLLEKEDLQNDKAREYLDVLTRQSAKLKKLIEDLVQASKASTGNLDVDFEPTNVSLLLRQAEAEYRDKAEEAGLEWMMRLPEKDVYIFSDGKLLWRVFDNLLNNRVKYSLSGTRLYVDCSAEGGKVCVNFRNVSKAMLNISADELMERFVRGDSSRNTEGSGLGLSISQSLVRMLNGSMELTIDGDLFKVNLSFDRIEAPKEYISL